MNVLIVYAHPEPKSFNGAMRDLAVSALTAAGYQVVVSDLYAEGFNPAAGPGDFAGRLNPDKFDLGHEQMHASKHSSFAPEVQREIDRLMAADLLILQFPMWWWSMPAILKGWLDRVFAFGVTYDFGRTWNCGVMHGRRAMLAFTTSGPAASFSPDGRNGDMERILWPVHGGVLALCGYDVLAPFIAHSVAFIPPEAREEQLAQYRERLLHIGEDQPLFFHRLEDYGADHRLKPEIEPHTPGQHRGRRWHL
jgi:NAD(P)H dehydrogenase (quinone)